MPIYEYICQKCGAHLEVNQRISDKPLTKHSDGSKCGGELKKIISSNAFHLKGTGWYKTDYAKSGSSSSGASKKAEPKSGSSGD
ncbi:MAG: zinc ribbon domain-containing protein [Nitrospinae bacterium]|nr:zinc ribbon domain-containing protein [Nitrospinota bacterium]